MTRRLGGLGFGAIGILNPLREETSGKNVRLRKRAVFCGSYS
jgi:hypothetical protein